MKLGYSKVSLCQFLLLGVCEAFVSTTQNTRSAVVPSSLTTVSDSLDGRVEPLNGWTADPTAFAWGLPGAVAPLGEFDPVGFSSGCSLDEMKRLREAEVVHGRVSMLAAVGFPVAEVFHPLFDAMDGPAIRHLDVVRAKAPGFFEALAIAIGFVEMGRALIGWTPPNEFVGKRFLRAEYYPGDIGFDPLGLKPTDAREFEDMQTKELQNGRLAMIAIAGMVAQEIVSGTTLVSK